MATLTFSFDTGSVPLSRITGAFALAYNYQANIPDPAHPGQTILNPETQAQFARRMVQQYIVDVVKSQDVKTATQSAAGSIAAIVLA